jgi:MYXO-CTERM domain-containing protein
VGGNACSADGKCATLTSAKGGCGCRAAPDEPRDATATLVLVLGLAGWVGRRRSS